MVVMAAMLDVMIVLHFVFGKKIFTNIMPNPTGVENLFQDDHYVSHIGCWYITILINLDLSNDLMLCTKL